MLELIMNILGSMCTLMIGFLVSHIWKSGERSVAYALGLILIYVFICTARIVIEIHK